MSAPEGATKTKPKANGLNVHQKLAFVQARLRVTKDRGKGHDANAGVSYEFRNAEDILEAVKPLCAEVQAHAEVSVRPDVIGASVPLDVRSVKKDGYGNDTWALISGPRFAAIADAIFTDCETGETITRSSFAFIDAWRKGQTEPEKLCGSADSYASKYALQHLFALDNNRDVDELANDRVSTQGPTTPAATPPPAAGSAGDF